MARSVLRVCGRRLRAAEWAASLTCGLQTCDLRLAETFTRRIAARLFQSHTRPQPHRGEIAGRAAHAAR